MTCIIGFIENKKVYIGGDSAGIKGNDIRIRKDEKVFKKGNMIFGFTSSFRMGQILRYSFDIPFHNPKKNDYEYLCTIFIDELIKSFKEKGYSIIDKNQVSGGVFLIGYKGNLYKIESDFQVGQIYNKFDACGCGEDYALGSLEALKNGKMTPKEKIIFSLKVAATFSSGVQGPFNIVQL